MWRMSENMHLLLQVCTTWQTTDILCIIIAIHMITIQMYAMWKKWKILINLQYIPSGKIDDGYNFMCSVSMISAKTELRSICVQLIN
jgi:hypothetical protein